MRLYWTHMRSAGMRLRPALRQDPTLSDWDSNASTAPTGAIRGGAAIAMSKIGGQVLILFTTVLLARLLTPREFGAVAVITAVLALGLILQEAGLSVATIQRERVSTEAVSTMFWINVALGLTLTTTFAALSHPIANFFRQPDLATICQATSLTFLLNGLVVQHRALLQRSMRFMTTARIDLGSVLVGGLCAIALAAAGFGYWALVAQLLIRDTLAMLMLAHAVRWRFSRPAVTSEVREMLVFGISMLGFNVMLTVSMNLQAVLVGRGVGLADAGIYTRAYALANIPQTLLQSAAAHVALPRLSRAQRDDAGFANFYYSGVQLMCLVTLPIVLGFAVFGDQIALVVYGSQWGEASDLLRVFSVGLAVAPLLHSTGPVFIARGDPHRMFRWGVFGACAAMIGTVIGLRWGTVGVAWGLSATMLFLLLPCLMYSYRGTELSVANVARAVGGIYAAAACALPLGWAARQVLASLPDPLELVLGLGFSAIMYVVLCYFVFGQKAAIRNIIERLLPKFGRPTR